MSLLEQYTQDFNVKHGNYKILGSNTKQIKIVERNKVREISASSQDEYLGETIAEKTSIQEEPIFAQEVQRELQFQQDQNLLEHEEPSTLTEILEDSDEYQEIDNTTNIEEPKVSQAADLVENKKQEVIDYIDTMKLLEGRHNDVSSASWKKQQKTLQNEQIVFDQKSSIARDYFSEDRNMLSNDYEHNNTRNSSKFDERLRNLDKNSQRSSFEWPFSSAPRNRQISTTEENINSKNDWKRQFKFREERRFNEDSNHRHHYVKKQFDGLMQSNGETFEKKIRYKEQQETIKRKNESRENTFEQPVQQSLEDDINFAFNRMSRKSSEGQTLVSIINEQTIKDEGRNRIRQRSYTSHQYLQHERNPSRPPHRHHILRQGLKSLTPKDTQNRFVDDSTDFDFVRNAQYEHIGDSKYGIQRVSENSKASQRTAPRLSRDSAVYNSQNKQNSKNDIKMQSADREISSSVFQTETQQHYREYPELSHESDQTADIQHTKQKNQIRQKIINAGSTDTIATPNLDIDSVSVTDNDIFQMKVNWSKNGEERLNNKLQPIQEHPYEMEYDQNKTKDVYQYHQLKAGASTDCLNIESVDHFLQDASYHRKNEQRVNQQQTPKLLLEEDQTTFLKNTNYRDLRDNLSNSSFQMAANSRWKPEEIYNERIQTYSNRDDDNIYERLQLLQSQNAKSTNQNDRSQIINSKFRKYQQPQQTKHTNISKRPVSQQFQSLLNGQLRIATIKKLRQFTAHFYLHSGRHLPSSDPDGLSDPFVRIYFQNKLMTSSVKEDSLIPQWRQTMVLRDIIVPGDDDYVSKLLSFAYVYDEDKNSNDLLGYCTVSASHVKQWNRKLLWIKLNDLFGKEAGEILCSLVLYEDNSNIITLGNRNDSETGGKLLDIPQQLYPKSKYARVEILLWGLRDLQVKCKALQIGISLAGKYLSTSLQPLATRGINKKTWLNFQKGDCVQILQISIPFEACFMPSFMITLNDENGNTLAAYNHDTSIEQFEDKLQINEITDADKSYDDNTLLQLLMQEEQSINTKNGEIEMNAKTDWWTRYYASLGQVNIQLPDLNPFIVYGDELESEYNFNNFSDILLKLPLSGQVLSRFRQKKNLITMGLLRCAIRWKFLEDNLENSHEEPEDISEEDDHPQIINRFLNDSMQKTGCHVKIRLYIVEAFGLKTGKKSIPDPYLALKIGTQPTILFSDNFILKSTNPQFGEFYERDILLPVDDRIEILIYDKNRVRQDELLGSTVINLEERYYNCVHGKCGVPFRYQENNWRDHLTPDKLLDELCLLANIGKPYWRDDLTVEILNKQFCHATRLNEQQIKKIQQSLRLVSEEDDVIRSDVSVCCLFQDTTVVTYKGQISSVRINEEIDLISGIGSNNFLIFGSKQSSVSQTISSWIKSTFQKTKSNNDPSLANLSMNINSKLSKYTTSSTNEIIDRKTQLIRAKYQLALDVLHVHLPKLVQSFRVVPEHVEIRQLMHPDTGTLSTGSLALWMDLFPGELNPLPKPICIMRRKPILSELRIIVYDIYNIVSSENKPDVYIEIGIPGLDSSLVQRTDVHQNVPDRRARFNFRLVFTDLEYFDIDKKFNQQNQKIEPQIEIKVLDKNIFGREELGILVLPLTSIPDLGNLLENATREKMENGTSFFNIFERSGSPHDGREGFWPLFNKEGDVTGVINMELQSYTKAEATEHLGGIGNDPVPDNQNPRLGKPKRPRNKLRTFLRVLAVIAVVLGIIISLVFIVMSETQYLTIRAKSQAFPKLENMPSNVATQND